MSTIGRQKPTSPFPDLSTAHTKGKNDFKHFSLRPPTKAATGPFQEIAERKLRSRQFPTGKDNELEGNPVPFHVPSFFPWAKREGVVASPVPSPATTREPCRIAPSVDRLWIGPTELGGEARIRVASGLIAGAEVQIIASKHGVQASVLSTPEHARQNVEHAMAEMAYRLRRKGYSVQVSGRPLGNQNQPQQEGDDLDEP